ncbi:hypothetical protein [Streptomyces sp. NPDC127574]|uniref:hypothetical protein n=1 Tax=Streptomyces sp. NPDC127574 TaxID=3345401 RepID=UPI003625478B
MNGWIRWILVTLGVVAVFWLGLLIGRWLPGGGPEDEAARWGIAVGLASVVSAVAAKPLVRWAESNRPLSKRG